MSSSNTSVIVQCSVSIIHYKRMITRLGRFLLIIALLTGNVTLTAVQAQVSPDTQRRYAAAVKRVKDGDYERAKQDLLLLMQQKSPVSPYAGYYYSLACYRQRNFTQAKTALKQLADLFPDWRKMSEANYLLAAVSMEMEQYSDALLAIQQVNDASLRTETNRLEQSFISKITDLQQLKDLNKSFPNDRVVGLALIDLIQRTASDKDDLELSDRLTNRFGVPGNASQSASTTTNTQGGRGGNGMVAVPGRNPRAKGYYNIAIMFPFRLDEFDAGKRGRSNQYVYDLYDGIKMAKARLQEEGITINLFAYDLDNDANKALELVNSPAFAQTDLIIGPLYIEPNRIAAAYANQNNILLLNPIATNSELVSNQGMAFLAQPSMNQQALKVAEQVKSLSGNHKAAIYFGASRKDSLLASAYLSELKRQNYQVVDFRKLTGTAQAMADAIRLPGLAAGPSKPSATTQPVGVSLGHIFLASSNDEDGSRVLEALNKRHVNGPLIATASAFDVYKDPGSTFTRRELYLLYPDFIDATREPVIAFQEQYLAKRNTIPSVFASEGYDMMLFFGRQLARNGAAFKNRATLRTDADDYLLSGFDYSQGNDNQIVPIVKFDEGRLVKINE